DGRGRAIGLCEPRCERQPSAPAILSDMRNACIHSKRGAAAPDRRPRRYTRRSRDRQAPHDHLDFERTELGPYSIQISQRSLPPDERAEDAAFGVRKTRRRESQEGSRTEHWDRNCSRSLLVFAASLLSNLEPG